MEDYTNIYDLMKEAEIRKSMESLNEAMIYSERNRNATSSLKYAISIHSDGSQNDRDGYTLDPYIKICNGPSWTTCTKTIRISMKDARYFYHKDGKGNLDMTMELGAHLNNVMNQSTNFVDSKGQILTVYNAIWEDIIKRFNGYTRYDIIKFKQPDFTKYYTGPARRGPNDILIDEMKRRVDKERKGK